MSSRIAFFASSDRRPASRILAVAALASLAVHVALLQSPFRLPDRVDESPPLLATITELPPPPAPVETLAPVKPKHRRVARAAPAVPVETPAPEIVAAATSAPEPAREPEPVVPPPLEEAIPATPSLAPPRELPPRIDLAYRAFLGTRGFLIGDAVYRLEHSGRQYRISTVG
jgi:light-harvesting protein B-800-850 alpha chain